MKQIRIALPAIVHTPSNPIPLIVIPGRAEERREGKGIYLPNGSPSRHAGDDTLCFYIGVPVIAPALGGGTMADGLEPA
jgi:hypothetical protein